MKNSYSDEGLPSGESRLQTQVPSPAQPQTQVPIPASLDVRISGCQLQTQVPSPAQPQTQVPIPAAIEVPQTKLQLQHLFECVRPASCLSWIRHQVLFPLLLGFVAGVMSFCKDIGFTKQIYENQSLSPNHVFTFKNLRFTIFIFFYKIIGFTT